MAGRFDYVKYDDDATETQALFKSAFEGIEGMISKHLGGGRATALVVTNLEQAYMWIGKAIRDDQITRNEGAAK